METKEEELFRKERIIKSVNCIGKPRERRIRTDGLRL